jgi:integrase
MGQKLTERSIEKLACSAGKRDRMLFDGEQRGLAVRVMAAGSKSYVAQYTVRGRKRRVPLGSSDAISLAAARDATRVILGQVAQGRDPAAERTAAIAAAKAEAARQRTTVASLVGDWERLHLANLSANYAQEAPRALKKALTDAGWWERPAERLQREDVISILDEQGASIARSVAAYGSACFGWSLRRGQVAHNPFAKPPIAMGTTRRDRVLSDDELARVWRAACDAPEPYGRIVRMVTLTAQRKDEARRLAWAELSPDSKTWTIPGTRTKNDNPTLVPLCKAVRDVIGPPPKVRRGLVFPGEGGKPFGGFSKAKRALDEASGVTGWRLHDLRRTAASGLQRLGTALQVTEAILNHVSGSRSGIVGIYQLYEYQAEKVVALEAWAAHVLKISAPRLAHREGGASRRTPP